MSKPSGSRVWKHCVFGSGSTELELACDALTNTCKLKYKSDLMGQSTPVYLEWTGTCTQTASNCWNLCFSIKSIEETVDMIFVNMDKQQILSDNDADNDILHMSPYSIFNSAENPGAYDAILLCNRFMIWLRKDRSAHALLRELQRGCKLLSVPQSS